MSHSLSIHAPEYALPVPLENIDANRTKLWVLVAAVAVGIAALIIGSLAVQHIGALRSVGVMGGAPLIVAGLIGIILPPVVFYLLFIRGRIEHGALVETIKYTSKQFAPGDEYTLRSTPQPYTRIFLFLRPVTASDTPPNPVQKIDFTIQGGRNFMTDLDTHLARIPDLRNLTLYDKLELEYVGVTKMADSPWYFVVRKDFTQKGGGYKKETTLSAEQLTAELGELVKLELDPTFKFPNDFT